MTWDRVGQGGTVLVSHVQGVGHWGGHPLRVGECPTHPVCRGLGPRGTWPVSHPPGTPRDAGGRSAAAPREGHRRDRREEKPALGAPGKTAIPARIGPLGPRSSAAPLYAPCTRPAETVPLTSDDAVTPYGGSRRPRSARDGSSSHRTRRPGHARAAEPCTVAAGGTEVGSRRRSDHEATHKDRAQAPEGAQDDPGVFPWLAPPPVVTPLRGTVPSATTPCTDRGSPGDSPGVRHSGS